MTPRPAWPTHAWPLLRGDLEGGSSVSVVHSALSRHLFADSGVFDNLLSCSITDNSDLSRGNHIGEFWKGVMARMRSNMISII